MEAADPHQVTLPASKKQASKWKSGDLIALMRVAWTQITYDDMAAQYSTITNFSCSTFFLSLGDHLSTDLSSWIKFSMYLNLKWVHSEISDIGKWRICISAYKMHKFCMLKLTISHVTPLSPYFHPFFGLSYQHPIYSLTLLLHNTEHNWT